MTNKLYSISTGGQTGGASRTTTVQFLEAGLTLSGREVRVIDADPANAGYTEATLDPNSVKLKTLIREGRVAAFIDAAASENVGVIIDCGAGALSMAGDVVNALRDAFEALRQAGYQHISIFPTNSNKTIVERLATESIRRHQAFGKVIIGVTDLAGSGHFPAWLASADVPVVKIPVLAPGFIDLRMRSTQPLSTWLVDEVPDTLTAKATFAKAIASLLAAPELSHLLSAAGQEKLLALSARGVSGGRFDPKRAADATDEVLKLMLARHIEFNKAIAAMRSDPSSPFQPYFAFDQALRVALSKSEAQYPASRLPVRSRSAT